MDPFPHRLTRSMLAAERPARCSACGGDHPLAAHHDLIAAAAARDAAPPAERLAWTAHVHVLAERLERSVRVAVARRDRRRRRLAMCARAA